MLHNFAIEFTYYPKRCGSQYILTFCYKNIIQADPLLIAKRRDSMTDLKYVFRKYNNLHFVSINSWQRTKCQDLELFNTCIKSLLVGMGGYIQSSKAGRIYLVVLWMKTRSVYGYFCSNKIITKGYFSSFGIHFLFL